MLSRKNKSQQTGNNMRRVREIDRFLAISVLSHNVWKL